MIKKYVNPEVIEKQELGKINRKKYFVILLSFVCLVFCTISCKKNTSSDTAIKKVGHVVIIYMENHSFDNLFGQLAGVDGLSDPNSKSTQIDSFNKPYIYLPPVPNAPAFPTNLPNQPFNIDQYVPANQDIPDLVHRFYQEQQQIDGGKMDKFALVSNAKALTMGYYKTSGLPLAAIASQYTICDNFFHSAFGGSFLNHIWLIAAASPVFPNAPASIVAQLDDKGNLVKDGAVTPDGFAVNTSFSVNSPHPSSANSTQLVPNQTMATIGDRLSDKSIDWAWYSGGWDNALAGKPDPTFQFHHQPFIYFAKYADGTPAKKQHLKDETEFITAAQSGNLPAVSFVKPLGYNNEHPGYADVITGENHVVSLINAVRNGPNWNDAAIIITYDENGGFWDHVAPPAINRWGPGTRVPAIIVSPLAKQGYVDHTQYETLSILRFIEEKWNLNPLSDRDATATPLVNVWK